MLEPTPYLFSPWLNNSVGGTGDGVKKVVFVQLLCLFNFNENIHTPFVFKFHYSVDWAKALVEDVWIYHEVVVLCQRRINVCRSLPQDTLYVSLLGNLYKLYSWVDHQPLSWDILCVLIYRKKNSKNSISLQRDLIPSSRRQCCLPLNSYRLAMTYTIFLGFSFLIATLADVL